MPGMIALVCVLLAGVLLPSPAAAQGLQAARIREALDVRRAEFERAISVNDAAAMARLYAPNALLFPPGADTVRGREAIQGFLEGPRNYEIRHVVVELEGRGDTVYELGQWTQYAKEGGAVLAGGWYAWVWRRQPDDSWLVDRDLWNVGPARPTDGGG